MSRNLVNTPCGFVEEMKKEFTSVIKSEVDRMLAGSKVTETDPSVTGTKVEKGIVKAPPQDGEESSFKDFWANPEKFDEDRK